MQRFFNALSVSAFVMSGAMIAGAVVVYIRIPSMANKYISEIKLELTKTILDQVPVPKIPDMPKATGPAIPFK